MSEAAEWTERAIKAMAGPAAEWDLDPDPLEAGAIEVFGIVSELGEDRVAQTEWEEQLDEGERQMFRAAFLVGLATWAEALGRLLGESVEARNKIRDNLEAVGKQTLEARQEGDSPLMAEMAQMTMIALTLNEDGSVKDARLIDSLDVPDDIKALLRGEGK